MTDKVDFRKVTILDRELTFQAPNEVQAAMLHRTGKIAASAGERLEEMAEDHPDRRPVFTQALDAIAKSLDVIEAMVVYDADRDWLVQQMMSGNVDMTTLAEALTEGMKAREAAPVKKARRAAA